MMMRRKFWSIAIVAVLALALVLAAGCGSKKSTTSTTTPAAELVKAAQAAAAKTTGATMVADLSITVKGDAAKLGALSAQLGQIMSKQPITMHIEGSFQEKPSAVDVTMLLGVGGKNIPLAIKESAGKGYIQYGGKWYVLPASALKRTNTTTTTSSSDPVAEIDKALGVDVMSWSPTFTMIGTENVGGVDTSHVQLTADTTKAMADISKALANPQLWSQAGAAAASITGMSAAQITQLEGIGKPLVAALETKITDFKADMWIGNADTLTHKASLTLSMAFGSQMASLGLQGIDITGTVDLSNFNAPVTVTAPSGALPYTVLQKVLQKALKGLTGSFLGGATGL
jgi:anti-sigma-K factor RskA